MKEKKSPKAMLENKRIIFAQVGMIITLALVLLAFEWKTYDTFNYLRQDRFDQTPEDLIQITIQPKPPPPPKPIPITTILNQVDNDIYIDTEIDIDVEANANTEITLYVPDLPDEGNEGFVDDIPFVSVQHMPEFPGGEEARLQYLNDNLSYPILARETGIQGKVYLSFIIERDGSISTVELLRGIGGGCDEEAIRIIEDMPKWDPGSQRGVPVRVKLSIDIKFRLL